ncbi:MAG: NAD(P)/FAD-dependent oxidoreductase [Rhodospirillales bacterium]
MCALTAGARGRRVLVLDQAEKPGQKILISGGGRCNFTNLYCEARNFLSANPHFCKSALAGYGQQDFIALVDKHKIPWHEKTLGQLFCDTSARDILGLLLAECEAVGAEIRLGHRVSDVSKAETFRVETDKGSFEAASLVLATGGLSIPKMGATGFAHDLARQFGLGVIEPRPGLVPFTLAAADKDWSTPLSGLSTPCRAQLGKAAFAEALLFTHRGLSGPAVLQISSYWRPGDSVAFDLLPDLDLMALLKTAKGLEPNQDIRSLLGRHLPNRLALALCQRSGLEGRIGGLADKALGRFADSLKRFELRPAGTEGFAKAEVTVGGVDTQGLSSKTLEAKAVPGLFVIGEAVDVTGWLGGYNFQWAWSSGFAAGRAA